MSIVVIKPDELQQAHHIEGVTLGCIYGAPNSVAGLVDFHQQVIRCCRVHADEKRCEEVVAKPFAHRCAKRALVNECGRRKSILTHCANAPSRETKRKTISPR